MRHHSNAHVVTLSLGGDGVLRYVCAEGAVITVTDADEQIAEAARLTDGRKVPWLVDYRRIEHADHDARSRFATPEAAGLTSAMAILVGSTVGRLLGEFFARIQRPPYPVRLFDSEGEALAWLRNPTIRTTPGRQYGSTRSRACDTGDRVSRTKRRTPRSCPAGRLGPSTPP